MKKAQHSQSATCEHTTFPNAVCKHIQLFQAVLKERSALQGHEGNAWQCSAHPIVKLQLLSSKKEASKALMRWERCPEKGVTAHRVVINQKQVEVGH